MCVSVCASLCVPNIILAFICSAMSDTMIMDAIASHLVLPNRLTIPLVADLHVAQLRSPLPRVTVSVTNDLSNYVDWCRCVCVIVILAANTDLRPYSKYDACNRILWRYQSTNLLILFLYPCFVFCFFLHVYAHARELCVFTCWRLRTWPPRTRSSRA